MDGKDLARYKVTKAVEWGFLTKPNECSRCGLEEEKIYGHHEDYSKPFAVIWLCASCHGYQHHKRHRLAIEFTSEQLALNDILEQLLEPFF